MVSDKELRKMTEYSELSTSQESPDKWRETNRAELFKFLSKPDFQDKIKMHIDKHTYNIVRNNDGTSVMQDTMTRNMFSPFSKELKTSNLTQEQVIYVMELSDLAHHMNEFGAPETAEFLIMFRDTLLSAAPSKDAMFLKLAQSEYNIRQIQMETQKRKLFRRGNKDES